MPMRPTRDDWLLPTLEALVTADALAELKQLKGESLWDGAVKRGFVTDDALLVALSARFRMKIADLSVSTSTARDLVPETLARRYRIVPLTFGNLVP